MQGWIKLYRKLTDWEWYDDAVVKAIFIDLLILANHQDNTWHGQTVKRGSLVTSVATIAGRNGLTIQQVRTALNKLEKTGEINKQSTNKNTLIIVLNYERYQEFEDTENDNCQQTDNIQTTNKQQSNNNQITTNKNVKNIKNDKNVKKEGKPTERFTPPTLEEVQAYCSERNNNVDTEKFIDYYTANGWLVGGKSKMKDWKAAVRTWEKNGFAEKRKPGQISRKPSYDLEQIKRDAMMNTEIRIR